MDDTQKKLKPLRLGREPVVIGMGLVALDVVIPGDLNTDPYLCAGGTCGNVLTALAFLGWQAYPVARLSTDGASKRVAEDLRHWCVKTEFVTFDEDGSTPVVVQHIHNSGKGEPSHSFSRKCPKCGAFLPWYKAVRVADVTGLVPKLPSPQVFFFDRTSRGAISLAQESRDRGAIVVFEPSASSDPNHLQEALGLSHIVKVSSDRLASNEAVLTSNGPRIVIETLGNAGLKLRYTNSTSSRGSRKWHQLPPVPTKSLRDTAGAGDWCTAGIIYMLGSKGAKGLANLTFDEVREAIRVGQAMASWTCGFDGPRGGMYTVTKSDFVTSVHGLLNGKCEATKQTNTIAVPANARLAFVCESCCQKESAIKGKNRAGKPVAPHRAKQRQAKRKQGKP